LSDLNNIADVVDSALATRSEEAQPAVVASVLFSPYLLTGALCHPLRPYEFAQTLGGDFSMLLEHCLYSNLARVMHAVAMQQLVGSRQVGDWIPVAGVGGLLCYLG
jgi:hypothetical protein